MTLRSFLPALSALCLLSASCGATTAGENSPSPADLATPFAIEEMATFDEPWALAFEPATGTLFVTEKKGRIKFVEPRGVIGTVTGLPWVDYGGQGGLGDFIFAPGQQNGPPGSRVVYLSWAEAGKRGTRGAAVGKARMVCEHHAACDLRDLKVIWRQQPKVTGRGHYSHRLAFSPDGNYLFVTSGERQKMQPAQDLSNTLGTIVRLLPDGAPAPGNPFADKGSPSDQIWSYGHRNMLGLAFDPSGRLWALEHGPRGGDELNLVSKGINYGWPEVSDGRHYDGTEIPDHASTTAYARPAISWDPVIAPGGMIFYSGVLFPEWQGDVLIAAMNPAGLVRVRIEGESAREVARYPMANRIRAIAQASDGAIWIAEDGRGLERSRLLRLTPRGH